MKHRETRKFCVKLSVNLKFDLISVMDGNVLVYLSTSKRKILINFQKIDWTEWELVLTKRKHLQKANRNKNLIEHVRAVHRRNPRRRRRLVRRDLHRHLRRHQDRRRNLRLDHLRDLVHRINLRRRQNEILNTINNENDRGLSLIFAEEQK